MIKFGFAREDITPVRGIGLCGYFEPRPNRGMRDPLNLRAALFSDGSTVTGFIEYDLCLLARELVERFRAGIKAAGLDFADNLLFSANHTHTGPYAADLWGLPDPDYLDELVAKTVFAVKHAYASLADAELYRGRTECTTLAFNRRFWMKDGTVLTNPGKLNPDIVKPEGGIDADIPYLVVRQDGFDRLIIANISNHTDTIGDDFVSADWTGRMEREIQNHYGYDIPVMTLINCQGNINHFNVKNNANQTCYAEAVRIGKGYAAEIISSLYAIEPFTADRITVDQLEIEIPPYHVTDAEYNAAKAVIAEIGDIKPRDAKDLTSEGIAAGNLFVKKFFAERLVENRDNPLTEKRMEIMLSVKFGSEFGVVTIPGEGFVEIDLAIKAASRFPMTMVSCLTMGEVGYIGMPECYERGGGYETRPQRTSPAHDMAPKLIAAGIELLNR